MKWTKVGIATVGLLLVGCGGGDGGPTGPEAPDMRGSYAGTWTLEARVVTTGETASLFCPGTVTITSQSGGGFSGSFLIQGAGDCDDDSGTIEGVIRADGGLTLTVDIPGGDPNAFEDLTGCVTISGDSAFNGIATGSSISFDASFTTDCPTTAGVLRIRWTVGFQGNR